MLQVKQNHLMEDDLHLIMFGLHEQVHDLLILQDPTHSMISK